MKLTRTTRPVIIDFVGKPGAGKTYTKNCLLESLSGEYKCMDISDYRITARDYLSYILKTPESFLASFSLVFFNVPKSYKSMLKLFRKWMGTQVKIKKALNIDCDFILNDEGLFIWLQWIRGSCIRKLSFDSIPEKYKKKFFYPDLTVFVNPEIELSETRRILRDSKTKKFFKKKVKKKRMKNMLRFLKNIDLDISKAEKEGFTKVILYDNNGDFGKSLVENCKSFLCKQKESSFELQR